MAKKGYNYSKVFKEFENLYLYRIEDAELTRILEAAIDLRLGYPDDPGDTGFEAFEVRQETIPQLIECLERVIQTLTEISHDAET